MMTITTNRAPSRRHAPCPYRDSTVGNCRALWLFPSCASPPLVTRPAATASEAWSQHRGRRDPRQLRARAEQDAARRPAARHALDGPQGRAAVPDQRQPQDAADLRHRRRRPAARSGGRHRFRRARVIRSRACARFRPGKYRIQALLHKYETFHRGDGHVVKLPMDRGEGQQWNKAPGNLYSTPQEITIEAGPESRRDDSHPARQGHPADPRSADHQVHQARANRERAADQVLGPAHASGGPRALARGLRLSSRGTLSAGHLPRAFSPDVRRVSRRAARRRTSSPTTANGSIWPATTGSSRNTPISSTRNGPGPIIRAWSSSRFSTPIRFTTTRTP